LEKIQQRLTIWLLRVLFEFHRNENAKKPQTVHATYVISGIQKAPEPAPTNGHANDEDEIMQSSPDLPSSMPNQDASSYSTRIASIILAREEDLEGMVVRRSRW
jgi:DNA polymerase delta subunit 3